MGEETNQPSWAYICHPFSTYGDMEQNYAAQKSIVESYRERLAMVVPISPILTFAHTFSPDKKDHAMVMGACLRLLSACSEIHLYGDWHKSMGCRIEVAYALANNIRIFIANSEGVLTPW